MLVVAKHAKHCGKRTLDHAICSEASKQLGKTLQSTQIASFCPAARRRKLPLILPYNDLSVNVEIEESFNKCSATALSVSQIRCIIFNLRSNLLYVDIHFLLRLSTRSRIRCRQHQRRAWIVIR
jgi:hypothetical protein